MTTQEVDRCDVIRAALTPVDWAQPLLNQLPQRNELKYSNKPLLFELRFAGEIHQRGLVAAYEHHAGVGTSTVDFRLTSGGNEWLIELVSILTSDAVKRATTTNGIFFETSLSTDASDPKQSEEGEIILAQQKIGEKVFRDGKPVKFPPVKPRSFHMILCDTRGLGIGGGDHWDYREIAYGAAGLQGEKVFAHHWHGQPILGLFDRNNTAQRASALIRDRIHFLGFCSDEEYTESSLCSNTYYLSNPHLFPDGGDAVFRNFPMSITAAPGTEA